MNDIWQNEVHYCITHQLPSTLDGKLVFGARYPLCQYGNGTWFTHDNEVHVTATELVSEVQCELCAYLIETEHATTT